MIGSMTVSDEAIGNGQGLTGRGPEGDPLSFLSHRKSGDSLALHELMHSTVMPDQGSLGLVLA